jgi:hypothetical protein
MKSYLSLKTIHSADMNESIRVKKVRYTGQEEEDCPSTVYRSCRWCCENFTVW